jgi:hypothetical protein
VTQEYTVSNEGVNDEFERIWKEAVVVSFRVQTQYFTGGTKESMEKVRIAGVRAEIDPGTSGIRSMSANHITTTFGHRLHFRCFFLRILHLLLCDLQIVRCNSHGLSEKYENFKHDFWLSWRFGANVEPVVG